MNCSQLLERRAATNWEKPAQPGRVPKEDPESETSEPYRWSAVRFSAGGQTFAPGAAGSFKASD